MHTSTSLLTVFDLFIDSPPDVSYSKSKLSSQLTTVSREAPPLKRLPLRHRASGAEARSSLLSIELLPEVQNGITVLLEKLPLSRNVRMIFGARPYQMG